MKTKEIHRPQLLYSLWPLKTEVIYNFLHPKIYTELTKIKLNLRACLHNKK